MTSRVAARAGFVGRMYRVPMGGSRYALFPSVTSVLNVMDKAFLVPWAVRLSLDVVREDLVARESGGSGAGTEAAAAAPGWIERLLARASAAADTQRKQSADFGTRAHAAIDAIVKGGEPLVSDDIAPVVAGFRAWLAASGLTLSPIGDFPVYSRRYKYAGAADCLGCAADGSLVVLDFKTSNSIHGSYALQLAAYAHAVEEMWAAGELDVDAMFGGKAGPCASGAERSEYIAEGDTAAAAAAGVAVGHAEQSSSNTTPICMDITQPLEAGFNLSETPSPSSTLSSGLPSPLPPRSDVSTTQPAAPSRKPKASSPSVTKTRGASVGGKAAKAAATAAAAAARPNPIVDDAFILSMAGGPSMASLSADSSATTTATGSTTSTFEVTPVGSSTATTSLFGSPPSRLPHGPSSPTASSPASAASASNSGSSAGGIGGAASRPQSSSFSTWAASAALSSFNRVRSQGCGGGWPSTCIAGRSLAGSAATAFSSAAGPTLSASSSSTLSGPISHSSGGATAAEDGSTHIRELSTSTTTSSGLGGPRRVVVAMVVRIDKTTGAAEVKQVADLPAAFDAFKAALLLWHATTQTRLLVDVAK